MRYCSAPVRQRPLLRVAVVAAGLLVVGLGWRLVAGSAAAAAADPTPVDYVPLGDGVPFKRAAAPPIVAPAAEPPMSAPLDRLRVTSAFGWRRHPILGFSRMHQGVDFGAPEGAPVVAAADGMVTQAGREGGYGNLLRIRHGGGWATGYAHLMAFAQGVAPGAKVLKGEVIGFVGHTGEATGPHLHYEVSLDGVRLDPMKTPFGVAPTPAEAEAAASRMASAAPQTQDGALHLRPAVSADAKLGI